MNTKELKNLYLEFFKSKDHAIVPSASLLPENDPTVLFTTAGMHPLVPYLMGQPHPEGTRIADGTLIAASTGYGPSLIVERGSNSRDEDNLVEFQSNQFVVIKKSGLMGVGTREPTARLHVAGTLKVEGDIQADSYSGLKNSISMITARATVVDTAKRTVNTDTACPTGTSITVYGTLEEIQFWNGGMSHWYAKCQKQGNGIRASLYTDKGYAGHYLTCFGMCVRD